VLSAGHVLVPRENDLWLFRKDSLSVPAMRQEPIRRDWHSSRTRQQLLVTGDIVWGLKRVGERPVFTALEGRSGAETWSAPELSLEHEDRLIAQHGALYVAGRRGDHWLVRKLVPAGAGG
jgi:hypothetical protein